MLKYMLDTNIVIYTMKNRPEEVKKAFNAHEEELCISTVTLIELLYGAEKSSNQVKSARIVEAFIARLSVLDYDMGAAQHTGQIRGELAKIGKPIGPYDQMIAGHVRSVGLILVSNNVSEFEHVPGLRLDNWIKARK